MPTDTAPRIQPRLTAHQKRLCSGVEWSGVEWRSSRFAQDASVGKAQVAFETWRVLWENLVVFPQTFCFHLRSLRIPHECGQHWYFHYHSGTQGSWIGVPCAGNYFCVPLPAESCEVTSRCAVGDIPPSRIFFIGHFNISNIHPRHNCAIPSFIKGFCRVCVPLHCSLSQYGWVYTLKYNGVTMRSNVLHSSFKTLGYFVVFWKVISHFWWSKGWMCYPYTIRCLVPKLSLVNFTAIYSLQLGKDAF